MSFEEKMTALNKQLVRAKKEQFKFGKLVAQEQRIERQRKRQQQQLKNLKSEIQATNESIRSSKFRKVIKVGRFTRKHVGKATMKFKDFASSPKTKKKLKKVGKFFAKLTKDIEKKL